MKRTREISAKKQKILSKYNLSFDFYDKRYKKIQYQKFQAISKGLVLDEKIVLDAGCGTGLLLKFFLSYIEQPKKSFYSYIGIDISWNMLMKFRSKLKNIKKIEKRKINLILADMDHQPFREYSFNSVYSFTSLQNLPNIFDGINELIRVAKFQAEVKFSVLKKKLDLEKIISFLTQRIKGLIVIKDENIEDVIIQGDILK